MTLLHPSARYSSLVRQRIRVALGAAAALAAISLSPGSAQAYVVTVNGVQYDVTTFTGTYELNASKFATPANGGVMPWWEGGGSGTLAGQFATQVGLGLGTPNSGTGGDHPFSPSGPAFAYRLFAGVQSIRVNSSNTTFSARLDDYTSYTYAQATPVPAPLPLLGAALPLSFCRRLSSRSKRLRHGASRLA